MFIFYNKITNNEKENNIMCNTYNGYKNYETWNVALWMDNDPGSQGYWMEQAENAESITTLADMMKDEHEESMPEVTGVYADLLQAALDSVDWYEIAENYWEEYHQTEDTEAEEE
jgi:hypothetical protein